MQSPIADFATTLHHALVVERTRPLADVARAAGFTYPALYARISGRVPFTLEEARRVLCEVPDIRLVDALLSGTRFAAFERAPLTGGVSRRGSVALALLAMRQVAEIASELSTHAEAGMIDQSAQDRLDTRLLEAERALALIRHALPYAHRRPASDAVAPGTRSGEGGSPRPDAESLEGLSQSAAG